MKNGKKPSATGGLRLPNRLVDVVVFVSGAVVMVLELVGSRLMSPYFGNSLFVWTSLIGVMLGFMALGGFLGGRLADRILTTKVLFWILLCASGSISLVAFSEGILLPRLAHGSALMFAAVAGATILFAIPSALLGMVSPYCTRLRLHELSDSGATVGSLYALSTLGSITGTFAAGFWLIARVGSHGLLTWLSAAVLALSLLFAAPLAWKRTLAVFAAIVMLVLAVRFSVSPEGSFDTQYDRYFIGRETEAKTLRPVVTLSRDRVSFESAAYADTGETYLLDYYLYYDLALKIAPRVRKTLMIGGGTFSYPRHQLALYPASATDVVEIDGALIDVARSTFSLVDDPRMKIIVEDGRTFLNNANSIYDVVLIDAFKSDDSVPYQLTTYESMMNCRRLLDDNGILAMNVIAAPQGKGNKFLWAEYLTLKKVFPQVEAFAVYDAKDGKTLQNISIIASKSRSRDLAAAVQRASPELAAQRLVGVEIPKDVGVITDDFAPVDQYMMGL